VTKDWAEATTAGDVDRVCTLLDAGADVDARDKHGQTALMNAAHRGDLALVQALVRRGASLNNTAKWRLTALMLAVIANHPEVVAVLIAAGADPDIKGSTGDFARTPLEYAEAHGQSRLASLLRNGI
jgi:uncharacterized protein